MPGMFPFLGLELSIGATPAPERAVPCHCPSHSTERMLIDAI